MAKSDDWSIIRKYKANLKKCGGVNSKKCQYKLLTIYTKSEAERVHQAIRRQANKIGGHAGDGWWDMVTSIVVDGGKSKLNQAVKIWERPEDDTTEWDDLEDWANKQHKEKKIKLMENYLYPLQPCEYAMDNFMRDEVFENFTKYCKGQKMKDKKYQKVYEKWLADREQKKIVRKVRKSPTKKKTTTRKRKAPAKKKTTTKRKASPVRKKLSQRKKAPKKSARILRGKRNSPSTSATSVSVGTKRRGGDGKMYVCKTYKRGNKRVKRWFKV